MERTKRQQIDIDIDIDTETKNILVNVSPPQHTNVHTN